MCFRRVVTAGLPCPVSHQRHHSCVDCAVEPGRLSPVISEPFGLLLAKVGLQKKKVTTP